MDYRELEKPYVRMFRTSRAITTLVLIIAVIGLAAAFTAIIINVIRRTNYNLNVEPTGIRPVLAGIPVSVRLERPNPSYDTFSYDLTWEVYDERQNVINDIHEHNIIGFTVYRMVGEDITEDNRDNAFVYKTHEAKQTIPLNFGRGTMYFRVTTIGTGGTESDMSEPFILNTDMMIAYRAIGVANTSLSSIYLSSCFDCDPEIVPGTTVLSTVGYEYFTFTPDQRFIAYISKEGPVTNEVLRMRPVNDTSSDRIDVNADYANTFTCSFGFAKDSKMLFFVSDNNTDDIPELFIASLDNDMQIIDILKVTPDIETSSLGVACGFTYGIMPKFTPDGTKIVFTADLDTAGIREIYVYDLLEDSLRKLNEDMTSVGSPSSQGVSTFKITRDGTRVIYLADQDSEGIKELFSATLKYESTSIKISEPVASIDDVDSVFFTSPDSSMVIYTAPNVDDGRIEATLCSVDSNGTPFNLNGEGDSRDIGPLIEYPFTSDGTIIVLRMETSFSNGYNIVVFQSDGNTRWRQASVAVGSGMGAGRYRITRDDNYIVYYGDMVTDNTFAMYASDIPVIASISRGIGTPVAGAADALDNFEITANGYTVVYAADISSDQRFDLYYSSTDGRSGASGTVSDGSDHSIDNTDTIYIRMNMMGQFPDELY